MSPRGRSSCRSPAGRCPCSTRASARSTWPCATACGHLRRLAHGRDRDQRAAGAASCCSACSPTTSSKLAVGGAQYSVLCREDGGVLDDLFTYRLGARPLPDGHQRRQPREGPRVVPARTPAASTSTVDDALDDYAMLAVQGPRRARDRPGDRRRAAARALHHARRARSRGHERARLRHRLHRRGRRRAAAARPSDAPARLGRARCAAAPRPAGLGRARHAAPRGLLPPLRQRPDGARGPIEAGLGWCCKEDTGFIGSEAVARRPRGRPGREARRRSRSTGPGIARQGNPVVGGGEVTSGTLSPVPGRSASAWPTCPPSAPRPARALEIDVRGKIRAAVVRAQAALRTTKERP